jgi:multidrug efflux pump subunit AcrA (membrane-fusion protein)
MIFTRGVLTGIACTLLCVVAAGGTWWLLAPPAKHDVKAAAAAPATVARPIKEDQLNTITLTAEAAARLALRTGVVERRPMPQSRFYGGEVMIPAGRTVIVSAPITGILRAAPGDMPQPGQPVEKGRVVFELLPLLTPEGRANLIALKNDAETLAQTTQTQMQAAQIALARAKRVLAGEAGSQRAVDEAQAVYDLAQKSNEMALGRRELLEKIAGEVETGSAGPIPIESPAGGMLRNLSALPGQNVPAGAALFEVADLSHMWVRVPVYVGDLPEIDVQAVAQVSDLTARASAGSQPAAAIPAPPSANAAAGTVDLYYELENPSGSSPRVGAGQGGRGFRPNQRVGALLSLTTEADSLVVPWSAVLYDIYGGTWVYVETGERTYVRQRVVVRHVAGDTAVLASGPPPMTKIVTAGAAELFGTETGFSK